jgi:hypothetical protein
VLGHPARVQQEKEKFIGAAIAKSVNKASPPKTESKKPIIKPAVKSTEKPKDKCVSVKKQVATKAQVPSNYSKVGHSTLKPKAKVTFGFKSPATPPPTRGRVDGVRGGS